MPDGEEFKKFMALLGQILVVDVERRYGDSVNYLGFSPLFDEVEEGAAVPEYVIQGETTQELQADGTTKNFYRLTTVRREPCCSRCGAKI